MMMSSDEMGGRTDSTHIQFLSRTLARQLLKRTRILTMTASVHGRLLLTLESFLAGKPFVDSRTKWWQSSYFEFTSS